MSSDKKNLRSIKIDKDIISRILLVLLVISMVIFTIWVSGPVPPKEDDRQTSKPYQTAVGPDKKSSSSPDATLMGTEQSRMEPEVASDQVSTTGVLFGTAAVVLIILVGTLFTLWQGKEKKPKQKK